MQSNEAFPASPLVSAAILFLMSLGNIQIENIRRGSICASVAAFFAAMQTFFKSEMIWLSWFLFWIHIVLLSECVLVEGETDCLWLISLSSRPMWYLKLSLGTIWIMDDHLGRLNAILYSNIYNNPSTSPNDAPAAPIVPSVIRPTSVSKPHQPICSR